ncbi:DUF1989 domain-containing protein [Nocardia cyriacigeorgica]|uniref:DUF1989 domain-containing protein n=1 Tax=Nocardia cyriacigeorgica TaxID=135487 RepID=UPI0024575117|nr:DUF1989 domain-containing protein [Nocardia cyriacigeorgica]
MTRTTSSTSGARAHARAQAATAAIAGPDLPPDLDPESLTFAQRVPADGYTNVVLGRGTRLRLADPDGAACAHVVLARAGAPWERLNVADTMKVPWQAYLGPGHPLLSDQGRVLATIVTDDSGSHDALCGPSDSGRSLLRMAGAKQGLAPRDIAAPVSFFRGVRVGDDGGLTATGNKAPGAAVELILHLPLIVLIANAAHALDDRPVTDLDVLAWPAPADLGVTHNSDPEYRRAVENTENAWAAALDAKDIA